ncbi:MAG: EVE domain-containing protein [Rhizobacter sp.]
MERNNWIAVACAEHVARGRSLGIMQVGHGKGAPLKRLHAGDRVAYYSPVQRMGEKEPCQAFTAIGTVKDDRVYQGDMGDGFKPFRKDVSYADAKPASIRPLLDSLSFTRDKPKNWGYAFRFGLIKVTDDDMDAIAQAMGAEVLHHAPS